MVQAFNALTRAVSVEIQARDQHEVLDKLDKLERGELLLDDDNEETY
jgi:hypothetical protein